MPIINCLTLTVKEVIIYTLKFGSGTSKKILWITSRFFGVKVNCVKVLFSLKISTFLKV